jgi:hypothetical protein
MKRLKTRGSGETREMEGVLHADEAGLVKYYLLYAVTSTKFEQID